MSRLTPGRRAVTTLATAVSLAACAYAPAPAQADTAARSATVVSEGQTAITLPDTARYSASERELLRLERRRSAAIAAHDTAWLATLYAPDFQGVAANGRRVDRAALFGVFARDNPGARFRIDELTVREQANDAATVTGRLQALGADGTVAAESRYLHVYVRRNGRWQLVAAAGTAVAMPPGPSSRQR